MKINNFINKIEKFPLNAVVEPDDQNGTCVTFYNTKGKIITSWPQKEKTPNNISVGYEINISIPSGMLHNTVIAITDDYYICMSDWDGKFAGLMTGKSYLCEWTTCINSEDIIETSLWDEKISYEDYMYAREIADKEELECTYTLTPFQYRGLLTEALNNRFGKNFSIAGDASYTKIKEAIGDDTYTIANIYEGFNVCIFILKSSSKTLYIFNEAIESGKNVIAGEIKEEDFPEIIEIIQNKKNYTHYFHSYNIAIKNGDDSYLKVDVECSRERVKIDLNKEEITNIGQQTDSWGKLIGIMAIREECKIQFTCSPQIIELTGEDKVVCFNTHYNISKNIIDNYVTSIISVEKVVLKKDIKEIFREEDALKIEVIGDNPSFFTKEIYSTCDIGCRLLSIGIYYKMDVEKIFKEWCRLGQPLPMKI